MFFLVKIMTSKSPLELNWPLIWTKKLEGKNADVSSSQDSKQVFLPEVVKLDRGLNIWLLPAYTWVQNVWFRWSVYKVEYLCSRGQECKREDSQFFNIWFLWYRPVYIYWESELFPGTIMKWDNFSQYSDKYFFYYSSNKITWQVDYIYIYMYIIHS